MKSYLTIIPILILTSFVASCSLLRKEEPLKSDAIGQPPAPIVADKK